LVVDVHGDVAAESTDFVVKELLGEDFTNDFAFVDGVLGFRT